MVSLLLDSAKAKGDLSWLLRSPSPLNITFQADGYIPVDFMVEMCRKYRYTVRVYGKCVRQ